MPGAAGADGKSAYQSAIEGGYSGTEAAFNTNLGQMDSFAAHLGRTDNPHSVTAEQVGAAPTSRTVNGKALSADISLSAADVGAAASSHSHGAGDITSGVTNNTSTSGSIAGSTNLPTMNTLRYALNRTTSVAAADTGYTTYMARGTALRSSAVTPTYNGQIAWTYE